MGFGGGNMGKMLMKQMEEMQRKMERIQAELGEERIEASAGGNMVVAVANGLGELRRCASSRKWWTPMMWKCCKTW